MILVFLEDSNHSDGQVPPWQAAALYATWAAQCRTKDEAKPHFGTILAPLGTEETMASMVDQDPINLDNTILCLALRDDLFCCFLGRSCGMYWVNSCMRYTHHMPMITMCTHCVLSLLYILHIWIWLNDIECVLVSHSWLFSLLFKPLTETAGWWAKILPNQRMILVRMWRKPLDKRSCNLEQPWLVSSDPGIRTWAPWASTDAFDARFNGRVLFRRIGTATLKKDMWGMSLMSWATLMTLRKPKIWESTMSRCRLQDKSGFLSLVELNSGLQTLSLSHSFSDAEAGTTYPLVN